jgi:hypothetical protein
VPGDQAEVKERKIFQKVSSSLNNIFNQDLYGNGEASRRIIDTLLSYIPSRS